MVKLGAYCLAWVVSFGSTQRARHVVPSTVLETPAVMGVIHGNGEQGKSAWKFAHRAPRSHFCCPSPSHCLKGFGGCVLALADKDIDSSVVEGILHSYQAATGQSGAAHRVAVSEGAAAWDLRP